MDPLFDEDLFRTLVEHSLDAIAFLGRDGKVLYVSPPIQRVLGYSAEEFIAFDAFAIIHSDERPLAAERFEQLKNQPGSSQTAINRVRHKDGSWRWIETVSTNQFDHPRIGAVIANFRDVTQQRRAANAVREAEEKFRGIVESATEFAIFTTDLDGRINSWNSGATSPCTTLFENARAHSLFRTTTMERSYVVPSPEKGQPTKPDRLRN
jgi:PAS domain S-box-containing protein